MKKRDFETSRLIKNASEISRSCQNFPRPTFFEVPFATPKSVKHEQEVSVSLMFLPHFLFAFIRLKQGEKKEIRQNAS